MGDVSSEPTMEEILSSIKRVIEESETASPAPRPRRIARPVPPAPEPVDGGTDEVLELNERAPEIEAAPTPRSAPAVESAPEPRAEQMRAPTAASASDPAPAARPSHQSSSGASGAPRPDTILSAGAAEASRGQLEALSRLVVKPDATGSDTLEGMVREMLRPMLREWLDAQLPGIVESMVAKEIARIAGRSL